MAKVMVLQHVAHEILGTINPLLRQLGIRIKYINFGRDPLQQTSVEGYDGLVILGGPMNVDQAERYPHIHHEIELIQSAMQKKIPILGICLGAQLIAKAVGASVTKNACREIGWYELHPTQEGLQDALIQHFSDKEMIFQWHGDTFSLPDHAVKLVSGITCQNQAFKLDNHVYGFQFHLEVDEPLVERWLNLPCHQEELKALQGQTTAEQIHIDTQQYIKRTQALSENVFMEFCKIVGKHEKPIRFASR